MKDSTNHNFIVLNNNKKNQRNKVQRISQMRIPYLFTYIGTRSERIKQ